MGTLKIRALRLEQSGNTLYVTRMRAGDIVRISHVDYWVPGKPDNKQGYQREPRQSRLRRTAKFLMGKLYPTTLLPTAVVLNARGRLHFENEKDGVGTLTLRENEKLWIVDGQHRIGGFKHALEEMEAVQFEDFQLPVVITEKLEKYDEMLQFYVINTEQKPIRTDLANRLLQQQAGKTEGFTRILEQGSEWKVRATAVTDRLNANANSVWYNRIQAPNQKKNANHVVKEISFTTSLKPIVSGAFLLAKLHVDQTAELLARYWTALADLVPEAFEDVDQYVIQKTPGVFSLHSVFPLVFELARSRGGNATQASFLEVIRPMIEAEGGAEFWLSENDDGASQFGSMKGFRILAHRLESHLPKLDVAI